MLLHLKAFLQFLRLNRNASAHTVRAYESDLTQFLDHTAAAGGLKRSEPAARLQLWPISPDPGRGGCDVQFTLPASTDAALDVYDVDGRRVRELLSGRLGPGRHAVHWDERDAAGVESPSGLYFLRLQVGPEARSTKAFVIR